MSVKVHPLNIVIACLALIAFGVGLVNTTVSAILFMIDFAIMVKELED